MLGSYLGRCFRWGYFPETKHYEDFPKVMEGKKKHSILWAGRLLDWKHPEVALEIANRLKAEGYDFRLNMIGAGPMEQQLREQIAAYGLS